MRARSNFVILLSLFLEHFLRQSGEFALRYLLFLQGTRKFEGVERRASWLETERERQKQRGATCDRSCSVQMPQRGVIINWWAQMLIQQTALWDWAVGRKGLGCVEKSDARGERHVQHQIRWPHTLSCLVKPVWFSCFLLMHHEHLMKLCAPWKHHFPFFSNQINWDAFLQKQHFTEEKLVLCCDLIWEVQTQRIHFVWVNSFLVLLPVLGRCFSYFLNLCLWIKILNHITIVKHKNTAISNRIFFRNLTTFLLKPKLSGWDMRSTRQCDPCKNVQNCSKKVNSCNKQPLVRRHLERWIFKHFNQVHYHSTVQIQLLSHCIYYFYF